MNLLTIAVSSLHDVSPPPPGAATCAISRGNCICILRRVDFPRLLTRVFYLSARDGANVSYVSEIGKMVRRRNESQKFEQATK